jgi:hypothetical protein
MLRNAPEGGEPQPRQTFDKAVGEDSPKNLAGKIGHLVSDKIQMLNQWIRRNC